MIDIILGAVIMLVGMIFGAIIATMNIEKKEKGE